MRWFSLILLVLLLSTGATLAQDDDDETDPITLRVAGKCAANRSS